MINISTPYRPRTAAAVLFAVSTLFAASDVWAAPGEDIVGYVKTAEPDAAIWLGGSKTVAVPGVAIQRGSMLKTGRTGSIGVTFKDNTVMSVGNDTDISIDDYLYDPGKGALKLGATLSKGSLYYVSGVIAKLKPEAVAIRTPTGTIGVRGTRFLAHVDPADAAPDAAALSATSASVSPTTPAAGVAP